jgi:hypothetical protein
VEGVQATQEPFAAWGLKEREQREEAAEEESEE